MDLLPLPRHLRLRVVPALPSDLERIARWQHEVLDRNDPFVAPIYSRPERADEDLPRTMESYADPEFTLMKAIVADGTAPPNGLVENRGSADPRMVGFVKFKLYGNPGWAEEEELKEAMQDSAE
jgi:hypothetical protein